MGDRIAGGSDGSPDGLPVRALLLSLGLALIPAIETEAQESVANCSPAVARVVAIQGSVELQRAAGGRWLRLTRLDTALCAGDRLRTGTLSRAGLFVQPETMVRVNQNSVITIIQSADEISVEFFDADPAAHADNAMSCGAGYFITRFPKKFNVRTPHMNAAVEGTEFAVESSCDATTLTVLEGKVASETVSTGERRLVEAGQRIANGAAGPGPIVAVVKPEDAVQWVIRYPPISDRPESAAIPSAESCAALVASDQAKCLANRAEGVLGSGSVDEALGAIDAAIEADDSSSDAHALRAVIQIARNDKAGALESADRATSVGAENYRAWLARSYVQQANFELEAALDSAKRAQSLKPESSLAHARVAELLLSLGDTRAAKAAADAAVASNSNESDAHAVLGFVHLALIDIRAAQAEFQSAIERDSFSALPRLGLGLAMIRDGNLVRGREQIEIAVALDPTNSLYRSYIGKAYYEENSSERNVLARTQLRVAKELDDQDPTPYFYEAILDESTNQPVAAIDALKESIQKNDNRAVYRSRLQLDDDVAARSASLSGIYGKLGFDKLAIFESAKAIAENPDNYSAHNLLAAAYANLPRHDIARVSEVLQAQIRQPASHASTPPVLGVDNLTILRATGPTQLGVNEFNQLFNSDGVRFEFDGLTGERGTLGDQAQLSLLSGKWAATLGQVHYETDGFLENDAAEKDIYSVLVQRQIGPGSSIQLDARRSELQSEETFFRFDPERQLPVTISDDGYSYRLSGHVSTLRTGDWVWTAAYEDPFRLVEFSGFNFNIADTDSDTYTVEIQNLRHWGTVQTVGGVGYIEDDNFSWIEDVAFRTNAAIAYFYGKWLTGSGKLTVDAGLSADWYLHQADGYNNSVSRDRLNPKFALTWRVRPYSTLRLAAFSTVRRPFVASQTIEPTQVAGFNQYFSGFEDAYGDVEGTISSRAALALDHSFSEVLKAGLEFAKRQLDVPSLNLDRDFSWRESTGYGYVYRTFPSVGQTSWSAVLTAEAEFETIDRPQALPGSEGIVDLEMIMIPLGVRFFHGGGLTLRMQGSFVEQSGTFATGAAAPRIEADDSAWILNAAIDYQFPKRRGVVTLGVLNIGDEFIDLVETDVFNPRVATRRLAFLRIKFTFD